LLLITLLVVLGPTFAQEGGQKPAEPVEKTTKEKAVAPEKTASKPELPFQIQLLETHIRFESNADSRKEVHTIVRINNILGAHQFARLTFDYNRAFQQVEIPLVRISHANGGTSELLPSAVVDAPNPAVEKFPAYQDVRVKSVRILGLEEGDTIEYRVITTTTKHPLAPDFWVEHTFDRSGQVLEEHYEIDLPASREVQNRNSPTAHPSSVERTGKDQDARVIYKWERHYSESASDSGPRTSDETDVALTSFFSWDSLSARVVDTLRPLPDACRAVSAKTEELTKASLKSQEQVEVIYSFVSQQIKAVDLALGATGFRSRPPAEVLASGYGTPEDKFALFYAMIFHFYHSADAALTGTEKRLSDLIPRPSLLTNLVILTEVPGPRDFKENGKVIECDHCGWTFWLAPDLEVAPFGMVPSNLRGKEALIVRNPIAKSSMRVIPDELPFASKQNVRVGATLGADGGLSAKVKYTLRGDNELLLRVAFHQTVKEKWKDMAGLLAISDGFRGQVTSVNVSDPMATKDPFTVEYEITQAKFVDWSKKPVRIPALLPQIALPDPPAKPAAGEAAHAIELGTPLDVDTQMTLKLPRGTVVQAPAGTAVDRDYAKFSSKYAATSNTVTASRRVNFLLRKIPGDRAMDYSAFVRAVQSDQAQMITLVPAADEGKAASSTPKQ
jgi:hypothetical protein